MDPNEISRKRYALKDRWNAYISKLPMHDDPRWDEAMAMRQAGEWLEIIEKQIRHAQERRREYTRLREKYLQGLALEVGPNAKRTFCFHCGKPLEKKEGSVYRTRDERVTVCIRCDPKYQHCPVCDFPIVDLECSGCSVNLHWE